jgi:hypothetical protein
VAVYNWLQSAFAFNWSNVNPSNDYYKCSPLLSFIFSRTLLLQQSSEISNNIEKKGVLGLGREKREPTSRDAQDTLLQPRFSALFEEEVRHQ